MRWWKLRPPLVIVVGDSVMDVFESAEPSDPGKVIPT